MALGKKLWAQFQFAKERRLPQLLFNTIVVLVVVFFLLVNPNLGDFWDKSVGTISSIATFFVAIFLWFNDLSRDWKDSLEKRLFVDFNYKDSASYEKTAMKCCGAYLSGEADIRQWGQSIGRQMNAGLNLDFKPLPTQMDGIPDFDEAEKRFFKPYYLTIMLDCDPEGWPILHESVKLKVKKGGILIWSRQNGMKDEWIEVSAITPQLIQEAS